MPFMILQKLTFSYFHLKIVNYVRRHARRTSLFETLGEAIAMDM